MVVDLERSAPTSTPSSLPSGKETGSSSGGVPSSEQHGCSSGVGSSAGGVPSSEEHGCSGGVGSSAGAPSLEEHGCSGRSGGSSSSSSDSSPRVSKKANKMVFELSVTKASLCVERMGCCGWSNFFSSFMLFGGVDWCCCGIIV